MLPDDVFITLSDIEAAQARIAPLVRRTPVLTSEVLDAASGGRLYFKCENLQAIGAFKARGACNAVFQLSDVAAARGGSVMNWASSVAWVAAIA